MGEYFAYANHDKRLKFDIGLGAENEKFSGIGRVLGTRAFCLLLTESHDYQKLYSHTLIGSWLGERVSCIGDHTKWPHEYSSYRDITANAIVMLYQIDGAERLIEIASKNDYLFVQLAYLIFSNQLTRFLSEFDHKSFVSEFENKLGKEWTKKYKAILEIRYYHRVYDLVNL